MNKTAIFRRAISLLLVIVMLAADLVTPIGAIASDNAQDLFSNILEAENEIDLSNKDVGLLSDNNLTNYQYWKDSQNASVSVKEENGQKYINVKDDDDQEQPAIQRKDIDFGTGVKTISFDLRINQQSTQGVVFELYDITKGTSFVRVEFKKVISYFNGNAMTKLPDTTIEDQWVSVIAVIDGNNNKYTLYYNGNAIITDAAPRMTSAGAQLTFKDMLIDLEIRSNTTNTGCDFDVRNYALYDGNQASKLLGGYMSELVPIERIDLTSKEVGLLTDTVLTNYNSWKNSQNASVSVMEESGGKYINIHDNDTTLQPAFQRNDIDFRTGVKTVVFDMRLNSLGQGSMEIEFCDTTTGASWIRLEFQESDIFYTLTAKNKTGAAPIMNKWVTVTIIVDAESNLYSLYYGGEEILFEAPSRDGRPFSEQLIDVQIRGRLASDSVDFDIRNYRVYSGNAFYALNGLEDPNTPVDVTNAGNKGAPGKVLNTDLGLPFSDDYKWTPLTIDTSTYDNYLAKRADLAASTLAHGGSADEVMVLNPVVVRGAVEVYVSPDGSDQNNGSKEHPLKTIQRALTFAAALEEAGAKGVVIYLREGSYYTPKTISITSKHSGKNNIPVIISSYPDEKAVITGGIDIAGSNFTAVTDQAVLNKLQDSVQDKIVAFDLKTLGLTEFGKISGYNAAGGPNYSVQINGENLTLARYPNANEPLIPLKGKIKDIGPITGSSSLGPVGTNLESTGVEFVMADRRPLQWENDGNIWFKGSLYAEWRIQNQRVAAINTAKGTLKLEADTTGDAAVFNCGAITNSKSTHYYYNILEELDIPGEYYLDTTNGILYLYPTCDMSNATVTYAHSAKTLFSIKNAQNVVLNGLTLENTTATAVLMYNCNQVVVQNCNIQNVGQGVLISGEKSGVIYSTFQHVTGRSVYFTDRNISKNNFLQNCLFDSGADREKNQEILVYGKGHVVSHNLIQDSYNLSIHLTWATECVVEYNEIIGGPTNTEDAGAIYQYSSADTYNNHIRFNFIHDIGLKFTSSTDPWAIYLDDASCGSFAYGNIIKNTPGGLYTNGGSSHVFVDNVVVHGLGGTTTGINISGSFGDSSWESYTEFKTDYRDYLARYKSSEEFRAELASQSPAMARRYQLIWDDQQQGGDGTGCITARDDYVANNIVVAHGAIRLMGLSETHTNKNNVQQDDDPFVDSWNNDFTLKPDVELEEGTVYVAPDMSRMGIVEYQLEDPILADWITTSLLLNNDLNMRFYVPAEHLQEGDYLHVTMEGKAPVALKVWKNGTGNKADKKYVTFEGIYATQMTAKVTVKLYSADGQAKANYTTHEDSVCEYAKRLAASNAATKWMRLMDAVLKYGAAAQKAATNGTVPEENLPTYGWDWKLTLP